MLARVKAGEHITLTERGVVIARIIPAAPGPLDELIAAGRVRPAAAHGRVPRPTVPAGSGPSAGDLVREMRDDERY